MLNKHFFVIFLIIVHIFHNLLKFAGVKAFLSGVRPVVVGLITGTAITLILTVVFSLERVGDVLSFDWKALVIFLIIVHIFYQGGIYGQDRLFSKPKS